MGLGRFLLFSPSRSATLGLIRPIGFVSFTLAGRSWLSLLVGPSHKSSWRQCSSDSLLRSALYSGFWDAMCFSVFATLTWNHTGGPKNRYRPTCVATSSSFDQWPPAYLHLFG